MTRPGFVLDLNRCTGCQACIVACWMEHRERQTLPWRQVHTFNALHHPDQPCYHLSLACHHCENPACLAQCPAGAYTRDPATGAVILDPARCLGCRYCTWACPYDAPKFSPATRTIEKCTFCRERLERGQEPACVARCPVEALGLEPERGTGPEVPGVPASGLGPGLRIVPLRREAPPETALPAATMPDLLAAPPRKITLRGEWTLLVFTTVLPVLVAWLCASFRGGPALRPWSFLALGAAALTLSTAHLGRPERAWRALRNLRTSWLSREVLLVSAFLALGGLYGLGGPRGLGLAAGAVGLAALFAVDRLYRVAMRSGLHSAQTLLGALYLAGWLTAFWPLALALAAGAVKLALYLHRRRGRPLSWWGAARLLAGFGLPWFLGPVAAAASAVLGDLLDRMAFYQELDVPTPQGELARELAQRLG
jgi:Fe-S-cluster-containing dehydrogenase component